MNNPEFWHGGRGEPSGPESPMEHYERTGEVPDSLRFDESAPLPVDGSLPKDVLNGMGLDV